MRAYLYVFPQAYLFSCLCLHCECPLQWRSPKGAVADIYGIIIIISIIIIIYCLHYHYYYNFLYFHDHYQNYYRCHHLYGLWLSLTSLSPPPQDITVSLPPKIFSSSCISVLYIGVRAVLLDLFSHYITIQTILLGQKV